MSGGRVIVGEAIWNSKKIAALEPPSIRAEYPWLYSLAGSNGVFEIDVRAIWVKCYAFGRQDKTIDDVQQILTAFEKGGLLFVWDEGGRRWGYWTGCDKPGRLPRLTWRKRDAKKGKLGPEPPKDSLESYRAEAAARMLHACDTLPTRSEHASSVSGLGFGSKELHSCADESSLHESVLPISTPDRSPEHQTVERLWDYYLQKLNKNPRLLKLTPKRRQKGRARLTECLAKAEGNLAKAEALMMVAIDNLAASTYHCENGYDSWDENLFKTGEKLDWWLERPELNKQRAG